MCFNIFPEPSHAFINCSKWGEHKVPKRSEFFVEPVNKLTYFVIYFVPYADNYIFNFIKRSTYLIPHHTNQIMQNLNNITNNFPQFFKYKFYTPSCYNCSKYSKTSDHSCKEYNNWIICNGFKYIKQYLKWSNKNF